MASAPAVVGQTHHSYAAGPAVVENRVEYGVVGARTVQTGVASVVDGHQYVVAGQETIPQPASSYVVGAPQNIVETRLVKSKYLSEIDIGYGYMDLREVSPLLLAKAFNRRRKVNIGHTKLTEDQVTRLFELINKRTTIRSLDVGYRDLSFLDDDLLKSALKNLESVNICPSKLITTPFVFSHKKIIY